MANDARFKQQIANAIAKNRIRILSGSSTTYHSASFLTAQSGAVTQFHSPILIPVASASAMPTPQAGTGSLYVKGTDNKIYFQDDAGTEYNLTSGGGGGSPGGSDTQLQYNNGGSFGGVASMTFDDSSGHLTIVDDKKLQFGTGNDASIEYDEDGNDVLLINGAATKFTVAGVEIENASDSGAAALTIDNDDVDKIALDIDAANTTAHVVDITADALTTGGILNLVSDSSDTTARDLVKIHQDHASAVGTSALRIIHDGDPSGVAEDATVVIEDSGGLTSQTLALKYNGTNFQGCGTLSFHRDTTSEADDMFLGLMRFRGRNDNDDMYNYAAIIGSAPDVTDGDEGGKLQFYCSAGGTAGTATNTELLSIGGEDVANAVVPSVVVNEAGINCDFRVESDGEDEAIFLDASANALHINKGETAFETHIYSTNDVAISVGAAGVIFNRDGHATNDFRVEGDTETHLIFADASADRVSIGQSTDTPAGTLEVNNANDAGTSLLKLVSNDTDQIAIELKALNIDADVMLLEADAVTTANIINVTADALTTGAILNLVSNSSSTSSRTLAKIHNDNTSATDVTLLELVNDATADQSILKISTVSDLLSPATILIEDANDPSSGFNAFNGPVIQMQRTNTATQDDQVLGAFTFYAKDDAGNDTLFAAMIAYSTDVSNGDECGKIGFSTVNDGSAGTTELLGIGGGDQAAGVGVSVTVNENGIDCDFRVESDNNTHMLFVDAADDTVTVGADDSLHKDGFAVINDFNGTTFENKLADGQFGSGEVLRYSPGADDTLTAGAIVFLSTTGRWFNARANAVANGASQMLGIGLGGSARTVGCLIRGFIRIPSTEILNVPGSGAVDGLPVYIGLSSGHLDFTAPSGSGQFVRIVGYAIDDDGGDVLIYFNPDATFVEIA